MVISSAIRPFCAPILLCTLHGSYLRPGTVSRDSLGRQQEAAYPRHDPAHISPRSRNTTTFLQHNDYITSNEMLFHDLSHLRFNIFTTLHYHTLSFPQTNPSHATTLICLPSFGLIRGTDRKLPKVIPTATEIQPWKFIPMETEHIVRHTKLGVCYFRFSVHLLPLRNIDGLSRQ
jgi:hypothetical protein